MTEQLTCYAASEEFVRSLVGVGLRDPQLGERHWRWALRFGTDPENRSWDVLALTTRSILFHGDAALPFDGAPDGYWHGLEAIVASCASAVVAPVGVSVAADLDAMFLTAGADPTLLPRALSRRPDVPLPAAEYVDARLIPHASAVEMARFRVALDEQRDSFTRFCDELLLSEGEPDLWLFSPGMPRLVRRPGGPPPALCELVSTR